MVGSKVPDYRGLFLRGLGGNSAALGVQQGDAIRNITGNVRQLLGIQVGSTTNPFYESVVDEERGVNTNNSDGWHRFILHFDLSRSVPTANENRPINKSVRYFVRSKS